MSALSYLLIPTFYYIFISDIYKNFFLKTIAVIFALLKQFWQVLLFVHYQLTTSYIVIFNIISAPPYTANAIRSLAQYQKPYFFLILQYLPYHRAKKYSPA